MAILEKKTEEKKQTAGAKPGAVSNFSVTEVLLQPRISEKATRLATKENKYVFVVKTGANKISVKKAVEIAYKVKVEKVNIVRNDGKNRNFGRTTGRTSDFKKAIVTLKKGEKIETGEAV
jgi:large subunit ribosomal protein L23